MHSVLDDPRIDWELLGRYHFDRSRFEAACADIRSGAQKISDEIIRGEIRPAEDVVEVLRKGERAHALYRLGCEALERGEVAVCVLNGGMATRFGNVVKGIVPALDDESFLALKAKDIRNASRQFRRPIPFVLMNSFATQDATEKHLQEFQSFGLEGDQILSFCQTIALRLTKTGELFIGNDGKPSYYAPGHGDFFPEIRHSGVLGILKARGIKMLTFSNVDNLGSTIDPLIIGHHLAVVADMSVEVTRRIRHPDGEWDRGGAPAMVDGRLELVEGFRFPKTMPPDFLPDFSTNNFMFSLSAIDQEIQLPWHATEKTVDGRPAIQLESIACEVSALRKSDGSPLLKLQLLRVPREGPHGRFFPIKTQEDLIEMREPLKQRLRDHALGL